MARPSPSGWLDPGDGGGGPCRFVGGRRRSLWAAGAAGARRTRPEASLPNIERHLHGADRLGAAIAHDDGNLGRSATSAQQSLIISAAARAAPWRAVATFSRSSPFSSSTVTPLVQTSKWKCGMASPCNGPASMPRLRLSFHSHVKTNLGYYRRRSYAGFLTFTQARHEPDL